MKGNLPLDDSLDVFTAARIAKVSTATMRHWCEQGRVGAWKPGGRWRVDKASLYALIEQGKNSYNRGLTTEHEARLNDAIIAVHEANDHLRAVLFGGTEHAVESAIAALRKARARFMKARKW